MNELILTMPKHPNCRYTCEALLSAGFAAQNCPYCLSKGIECKGGEHPSKDEIAASSVEPARVDWEHVKLCVAEISNETGDGQGIVVSPHLLITSLHGKFEIGASFAIKFISGEVKHGTVYKEWYEENDRDIALIKLNKRKRPFQHWLRMLERDVGVNEKIGVASLLPTLKNEIAFAYQETRIFMIEKSPLCRSQYYAMDGISGSGAVMEILATGEVKVVGVHVASHDNTEKPPPIKKLRNSTAAEAKSVSDSLSNLSDSVHGHSSYCLICEANKIPELITEIAKDISK